MSIILISVLLTGFTSGAVAAPLELSGDWWQVPAERTRHTTLVCSFDDSQHNNADCAREMAKSGGFGMTADVAGAHGRATQVAEKGGHLHFVGGSNFQSAHGTVRMMVKGDAWVDETPRWFFEARAADRIGILRDGDKVSLVFSRGRRTTNPISRLDYSVGDVNPDEWHSVVASWDRDAGMGWIAVDGTGTSGEMQFSQDFRPAFVVYVAGGFGGRKGGMNLAGFTVDDFVLYDVSLPVLQADKWQLPEKDAKLPGDIEAGARNALDFMADLQRWGGWQCLYTWPTLIGSCAQGREHVTYDNYIDNDKGNATPRVASRFLYGYQVLGDYEYLDVALRAGEFLLAAQDERGFWVHGYRMTVHGIKPAASERRIKFQDCVQAHPIYYLCAMYRFTGDERYLQAAKRGGEFYLAAQNPNGSWSHHYDAKKGQGENARGQPHGGELNDRAMNDAIDVMALMYHLTGDRKYVRAIKEAGDWLIAAQCDPVPLWADQYDSENNPAPARHFEPAAPGPRATRLAVQALREVHRFSGDERYIEPIQKCLSWVEENCPDGKIAAYIDPDSGRPIASWKREIYYLDDPDDLAYMKTVPTGSGYLRKRPIVKRVRRTLQTAKGSKPSPPEVTVKSERDTVGHLRSGAVHALQTQHEAGVWVNSKIANFMGSLGRGFANHIPRVLLMLKYIEAARTAKGELAPQYRGDGRLKQMAYPDEGWYELDWQKHIGGAGEQ